MCSGSTPSLTTWPWVRCLVKDSKAESNPFHCPERVGKSLNVRRLLCNGFEEAFGGAQLGVDQKRVEVALQSWGCEIPVDGQDSPPVTRKDPGYVGECKGTADPAFV